jgi:transcriptional regulator with XRE-family HTH domain
MAITTNSFNIKEKVDALCAKYNLSLREVAERAGVEVPHFQAVYVGKRLADVATVLRIVRYFNLDFAEFCGAPAPGNEPIPMGNIRFNHLDQMWEVRFPHRGRGPFYKNIFRTEAEALKAIELYWKGEYNPASESLWVKRIEAAKERAVKNNPRPNQFNAYPKKELA